MPNLQGPGDIFQGLRATVRKGSIQAVAYILMHAGGYGHAVWLRNLLQAGGDINAVAQDVFAVNNNIAQNNANAEDNAPRHIDAVVACPNALLDLDHALGGVYHGGEFQQ